MQSDPVMEVKRSIFKTKESHVCRALIMGIMTIQGCFVTSSPNYASLGLVPVAGTVTFDGVPLPNVEVRLENTEESIYSYGVTDASGRFELMFDGRTPGILPGRKLVRIVARRKSEGEMTRPMNSQAAEYASMPSDAIDARSATADSASIPDCYGKESACYVQIERATSRLALALRSDCSRFEAKQ